MADPASATKWRVVPLAQADRLPWSVYGMPGYRAFAGPSATKTLVVEGASEEEVFAAIETIGAQRSLVSLDSAFDTGLDMALSGASRAGTYQLMGFPIQRFNGVDLPFPAQLRFADHNRWFKGALESRLVSILKTGGKQEFAWDYHAPVPKAAPHPLWHVNQKGMHQLFGVGNHEAIPAKFMVQAKTLRVLKIGGRVFLVTGVVVDAALLGNAALVSVEKGTPAPIAAQAVRTAGSWAMAWAGAKAGFALGALAGVETGPGLALTAIGGGIVGGALGFLGADCVADLIYED